MGNCSLYTLLNPRFLSAYLHHRRVIDLAIMAIHIWEIGLFVLNGGKQTTSPSVSLSFIPSIINQTVNLVRLRKDLGESFAVFGNWISLIFERELVPDVVINFLGVHIDQVLFT